MTLVGREVRLAARPAGAPTLDTFEVVRTEVPQPGAGQVLVRNTWLSIDPYIRLLLNESASEVFPPLPLGEVPEGAAIGDIVASDTVPAGRSVVHYQGWREYSVLDAADVTVVDTDLAPPSAYLGVLGTTGLTAYVVVTDVTPVRPGDVVFVSAAAGAVGSVVGQLARKFGAAKVIGSAGGREKARKLVDVFGFDAAIDYRAGAVAGQLAKVAPEGLDLYVDNVGGDHLEAALEHLRPGGQVAMVGAISGYNAGSPKLAPSNLFQALEKEITLRGTQVTSHFDRFPEYRAMAASWLADGTLRTEETVVPGIEQAPAAFLGVLNGANTGKMLVRL
jgi:NADPH-dependent curcumin reductase CurA